MARQTDPATAALIAAAIARGGVSRVHSSATVGFSDRQYFLASRGDISLRDVPVTEQHSEQYVERVREARHLGATQSEALEYARRGEGACLCCLDQPAGCR